MEIIGTSSPLVYSELVVMIDPTVYLRRRQQRILVMTTTSFHLLVPKYPYDRCTKRQQEIPLLWIEKIYADRIDGQIIFQIRPDYDLWLELPSKTHFIHLFSMLHKLQQEKEGIQVDLEVKFVFDIGKLTDAMYISKEASAKSKDYISAKERITRALEEKKSKSGDVSKINANTKRSSPRKATGRNMFSPSAKTKSPRKKGGISKASGVKTKKDKKGILKKQKGKMKPSDTENGNVASKKDSIDLKAFSFNKDTISEVIKAIKSIMKHYRQIQARHKEANGDDYVQDTDMEFVNFEERVFSNLEFDHILKQFEITECEDVFIPSIKIQGKECSIRKLETRSGELNFEQKYLVGIHSSNASEAVKSSVMKFNGSFEFDEKRKKDNIVRFKYYVMEPVSMNLQILLDHGKATQGLPYQYVLSISKQILEVFHAADVRGYTLVGLTLRDIYLQRDRNNEFKQVKIYRFNRFKALNCEVVRDELRFEDLATCPKELLEQAFMRYEMQNLQVSKEMAFWTYGVILFRLLTGEYPYLDVSNPFEASELLVRLTDENYTPSTYINESSIDHPPAKFFLRKLLVQDPANLNFQDLLKDNFFDPNSIIKQGQQNDY